MEEEFNLLHVKPFFCQVFLPPSYMHEEKLLQCSAYLAGSLSLQFFPGRRVREIDCFRARSVKSTKVSWRWNTYSETGIERRGGGGTHTHTHTLHKEKAKKDTSWSWKRNIFFAASSFQVRVFCLSHIQYVPMDMYARTPYVWVSDHGPHSLYMIELVSRRCILTRESSIMCEEIVSSKQFLDHLDVGEQKVRPCKHSITIRHALKWTANLITRERSFASFAGARDHCSDLICTETKGEGAGTIHVN